jgi:hypothetical protein
MDDRDMRLEHGGLVPAPRDRVWAVLMDVPRAARLVPGLGSIDPSGPDRYRGTLRVQVGPIRLDLAGTVEVVARDADAGTATMRLDAADPRLGGGVRASLDLALVDGGAGGTDVRIVTDAQVLGRIGELGQPLIRRKADQIVAAFMADLAREASRP